MPPLIVMKPRKMTDINHATCESCFSAIVAVLKKNFYEAIKFIVVPIHLRNDVGHKRHSLDAPLLTSDFSKTTKMCVQYHKHSPAFLTDFH